MRNSRKNRMPRITLAIRLGWITGFVLYAVAGASRGAASAVNFPGWREHTTMTLQTAGIGLTFDEDSGRLVSVDNKQVDEEYGFEEVAPFTIELAGGAPAGARHELVSKTFGENPEFLYLLGKLDVRVVYTMRPDANFIEKTLTITNTGAEPVTIGKVGVWRFKLPSNSMLPHPHNDPSNAAWLINLFLRGNAGGLYLGIENPFAELVHTTFWEFELTFAPDYLLRPGESLECEPGFLGTYRKEGIYVFKELHKLQDQVLKSVGRMYDGTAVPLVSRLDQEVLDWGEVWGMQHFMQTIMPPQELKKPGYYLRAIGPIDNLENSKEFARRMAELEHVQHIEWNSWVQMDDPGSPALWIDHQDGKTRLQPNEDWREMVRHANELDIYSGTMEGQPHPGYLARTEWLRRDRDGSPLVVARARNAEFTRTSVCFANAAFFDWYLEEYNNLVNEYDLYMLAWDDAGGYFRQKFYGGYECWATDHDHPPGDVAYYTWRNWMNFLAGLHENEPGLALRAASGFQRGYPWSVRDLLEHHADFFDYAPGASWWRSVNYRFIPPYRCTTTLAAHDWEELRYNMFRSFAIAPQAMIWGVDVRYGWDGLPQTPEQIAFFKQWMNWASENVEYLRARRDLFREPWGDERINDVHVDMEANFVWDDPQLHGTAHCIEDRGFVFLFNPAKMERVAELPINHWLGLKSGERFALREVYPEENRAWGSYDRGEKAKIAAPPGTCMLLAIEPVGEETTGAAPPDIDPAAPVDPAFYTWDEIPWGEIAAKP